MSRKSFLWAGAALVGGYAGIRLLSAGGDKGISAAGRKMHEVNGEALGRLLGPDHLARTFEETEVSADPKVNGRRGLVEVASADWSLTIEGAGSSPVRIDFETLGALSMTTQIVELNCIEGWTRVMRWEGVRIADLITSLGVGVESLPKYVAIETPRRGYYTGLTKSAALHPQSILAVALNGQPVSDLHGGPVRHVCPILYGYKQLKHIGLIRFTNERPPDYWAERGYDWFGVL